MRRHVWAHYERQHGFSSFSVDEPWLAQEVVESTQAIEMNEIDIFGDWNLLSLSCVVARLSLSIPLFSSPLKQSRFFAERDRRTTYFLIKRFSYYVIITIIIKDFIIGPK